MVDEKSAAAIQAALEEEEPREYIVLPENWETIRLWRRIEHFWQTYPMGGVRSLDWPAIQAKISLIESRSTEQFSLEVIEGIEIMETVALRELKRG